MKTLKRSFKTICLCFGFIFGMALLPTQPIFAQGNIHYGRLNIKPQFITKLEHNNNIFLDAIDEIEDTIFTMQPKIALDYLDRPGNYFRAGYDLEIASYFKKNDNNYQKHQPYLTFGVKAPAGFFGRFSERFLKTADPYGADNMYGEGERTSRSENVLDFTFGYQMMDRYSVEAMFQNFALRYRDFMDQWQDRTENIFQLGVYMRVTPSGKTSMLAEYRFTDATYDRQNAATAQDHQLHDFLVGFRFEPGGKLNGAVKLGYGSKSFDNGLDSFNNSFEDNNTWLIETNVNFQFSEITNMGFRFIRSIEGSPDNDAASYVDTTIGFDIRHQVKHKTFFKSGLAWTNSDYRDERPNIPNKYFNLYSIYLGIDYNIQEWLRTGFKYSYDTKTASHSMWYDAVEYSNNKFIVDINAMF
jgi:hypothetical protein